MDFLEAVVVPFRARRSSTCYTVRYFYLRVHTLSRNRHATGSPSWEDRN